MGSKTVADIAVGVEFDIGPLIVGAAKAEAVIGKFTSGLSKFGGTMQTIGTKATQLGTKMSLATAAIGGVAGGLLAITKQGADVGDVISNAAKAAGMSTGYFQETAYALEQVADMSSEDVATAMAKLNTVLGQAQQGSKSAIAAFAAIGVSQEDIASGAVTSQAAMEAMLSTLDKTKDPAIAAAIAADLLGKTGGRMGSMLAGAGTEVAGLKEEARKLGIVMSDEAVQAANDFNDKWESMGKQINGIKMQIASVLLPVLVDSLLPAIQEKVIPAISNIITKVGEWIDWFGRLPQPVQDVATAIAVAFAAGGPVLLAIGAVSSAISLLIGSAGPIGLFILAAGALTTAWTLWGDDIKAAIGPAIDWVTEKFNGFLTLVDTIIGKLSSWKSTAAEFIGAGDPSTFTPNPNYVPDPAVNFGAGIGAPAAPDGTPIGGAVADGMVNGLTGTLNARMPEVTGAVDGMTQAVRDTLGIRSPSTVFAEIGQYMGEGLAQGIANTQAMINTSVEALGGAAVTTMQGTASEVLGILGTMFQGSKAIAAAQAIVNAWAGASEALKLPFPANLLAFGKVLATGFQAVRAIQGTNANGSSGGGGAAPAPAAAAPAGVANITLVGDTFSRGSVESLFEQINAGLRQGQTINVR